MLILLIFLIYCFFTIMMVVLGVAFITLLERKILGFIQFRYGPNKVGVVGLFQPFTDGFKLLSKSKINLLLVFGFKYLFMPFFMFLLMLMVWVFFPSYCLINSFLNSGLVVVCFLSVGVYPIMVGGWFSMSLYSMLGSIRCVSQMISYEVSLIIIMYIYFLLLGSFNLFDFFYCSALVFMLPMTMLYLFSVLMELNRSPSDLVEGESELVSGFNTEFYGLNFSLIFLGEYGMIMFMSGLMVIMIFGLNVFSLIGLFIMIFLIYMIIVIRGSFPRIRYDFLMYMCWTSVISFSLGYMVLVCGIFLILW